MHIDAEGHIVVTPREFQAALVSPARLINDIWLPGTPWAFPTYAGYCEFLASLADGLGVHPRNLVVRGSTKVGFSIAPRAEKVWRTMRPDSDLDLAIVDPDYYHFFDREIRMYERSPEHATLRGIAYQKARDRRRTRGFYTYRYQDFPDIACVQDHDRCLDTVPWERLGLTSRPLSAFIYRDWWSVFSRGEYDLASLHRAVASPGFPQGEDVPRPPLNLSRAVMDSGQFSETASVDRRCGVCGTELVLAADGQTYRCPQCLVPT